MKDREYIVRFHWGYWMLYGNYPFQHANYCWDGGVSIENGSITRCSLIEFNGYAGPGRESYIDLSTPSWHWQGDNSNNRLGGIILRLQGSPDSKLYFSSRTADLSFTIRELLEKKMIQRHVGSRFSNVDLTAMFDGYDSELDHESDIQAMVQSDGRYRKLLEADEIIGPRHRWFRTDWAWVVPGESAEVQIPNPPWGKQEKSVELCLRVTLRCAAVFPAPKEESLEDILSRGRARNLVFPPGIKKEIFLPYEIWFRDKQVAQGERFFTYLGNVPLMEEISFDLPEELFDTEPGNLRIQNNDKENHLLIGRVYLEEKEVSELSIGTCPLWVLKGTEFEIEISCLGDQKNLVVNAPESVTILTSLPEKLLAGKHSVKVKIDDARAGVRIRFTSATAECEAEIEQVFAGNSEAQPMLVGIEDKTLPVNSPGHREEVIRHMATTQLGDLLIFRIGSTVDHSANIARLCREGGIYIRCAFSMDFEFIRAMKKEAGNYFLGFDWTEHDGPLWGYVQAPIPPPHGDAKPTMKTAYEGYLKYVGGLVEKVRDQDPDMKVWLMVSAIGHSLGYAGGMDTCFAQFNKSHNSILIADARGAAKAFRKPFWGTYQAEGAHVNPEGAHHIRMWWLSLYLSFISGAACANDEEAIYRTWHERLYSWGDRMPRTRRRITREFNRYIKTHPRGGSIQVKQALLLGRYSCDVTDGIGASDEHRATNLTMVWRNFGEWSPDWRPSSAEYGFRYLDVFFPGAWLQTLDQSVENMRRWFSGTPRGEIDLIPVDTDLDILSEYPLLLMLGWNTTDQNQYDQLKSYVEAGGRLFMSVPHLTTNIERDFLWNGLEPLNLLNDGDFSDLFGVKIVGKGEKLSKVKAEEGVENNLLQGYAQSETFFRFPPERPQHEEVNLAEIALQGAEVLARDVLSDKPILVRKRLGKGEAYLLCTHAYPGNSWLVPFVKPMIRALTESVPWPIALEDPSGDVHYTVRREEELYRVHLLNTDWTAAANEKPCKIRLGEEWIDLRVAEGALSEIVWVKDLVLKLQDAKVMVDSVTNEGKNCKIQLHGYGLAEMKMQSLAGRRIERVVCENREQACSNEGEWTKVEFDFGSRSEINLKVDFG